MKYYWDMERFKSIEAKLVLLLSVLFGGSLVLFIIFRHEQLLLGLFPSAIYTHYYLYKPKYLKHFSGAFVELTKSKINIVRPEADYEASISFNSICAVSNSHSFFLPSVVLHQDSGQKLELVNFNTGLAEAIKGRIGKFNNGL